MAGPSLQSIFGYATLSEAIMLSTNAIPNPLPEAFMKSNTKCVGANVRWRQFTGERRVPKRVRYGAPARVATLRDVGERNAKCMHFFEKESLDPLIFKQLQGHNTYEHDPALEEVQRQVEAFGIKFGNARIAAPIQVLRSGIMYFDSDGNLLPNSAGADSSYTVSFGMNANNQDQLNGIISQTWADDTADIPLQLRLLKKQARRLTGYPLKFAFYGENVPSYMMYNQNVNNFLWRHPAIRDEFLQGISAGEIPDGLFGFTWIPAYEAFYEDNNATNQDLWDPDQVTFTPEPNPMWWDIAEGSFEVPTTINIQASGLAAMNSMKTVHGMGGYGVVIHNPVTVESYYFDTFLPLLKNPDAIYQADVAP